jgi:para-nitrobenzyl esterase
MRSFFDAAPTVSKNVPMLIGSVSEEGNRMSQRPTEEEWRANLSKAYGERKAGAIVTALKKTYPQKKIQNTVVYLQRRPGTQRPVHSQQRGEDGGVQARAQRRTCVHLLLHVADTAIGRLAWCVAHAELQFCFDNTKRCEQGTGNTPEAQALAKKMASAWATFAATGNPACPNSPGSPAIRRPIGR